MAASDNMAIGALRVLQAHGVRIPGDVALAGLNDESQSPFVSPPLTTGPLHFYEQARRATEMLLALLAGTPVTGQVILPTQLLIRQSCGCPDPLVAQAQAARDSAREAHKKEQERYDRYKGHTALDVDASGWRLVK